jgi:hypothetical protein
VRACVLLRPRFQSVRPPLYGGLVKELEPAPLPANELRPPEGTLAVFYDEIAADLSGQHGYVESLNQRAQQLFGFATVILTILAGVVPEHPGTGTKLAYLLGVPFFALAAFFSGRAWDFRKWRYDPDVQGLWDRYRGKSEEHVRHQVIQNRLACLKENETKLTTKLRQVKWSQRWLYLGFAYLVGLLFYRVISG